MWQNTFGTAHRCLAPPRSDPLDLINRPITGGRRVLKAIHSSLSIQLPAGDKRAGCLIAGCRMLGALHEESGIEIRDDQRVGRLADPALPRNSREVGFSGAQPCKFNESGEFSLALLARPGRAYRGRSCVASRPSFWSEERYIVRSDESQELALLKHWEPRGPVASLQGSCFPAAEPFCGGGHRGCPTRCCVHASATSFEFPQSFHLPPRPSDLVFPSRTMSGN